MHVDQEIPFLAHVAELRRRLITSLLVYVAGAIAGLLLYDTYIGLLIQPFGEPLYITRIEQGFTLQIKISLYAGLVISLPFHLYNIVAFLMPALTARERKILAAFVSAGFLLALAGTYVAYCQVLPLAVRFLKSSSFLPADVITWLDFRESTMFVVQMLMAFIALFQFPLLLLALMMFNLVDRQSLLRNSRYAVVAIFIVSAIATPPDVVSQIGMALPLILLFYLTILVAKAFGFGESDG